MPGVVAVITGADLVAAGVKPLPVAPIFKRPDGSASDLPLRRGLAHEAVRFVGEAVVAVVAETAEQAKDALEAILVEYDERPLVTDLSRAHATGAPLVYELDANLTPVTHYYLGDPKEIRKAQQAVAIQGKAR